MPFKFHYSRTYCSERVAVVSRLREKLLITRRPSTLRGSDRKLNTNIIMNDSIDCNTIYCFIRRPMLLRIRSESPKSRVCLRLQLRRRGRIHRVRDRIESDTRIRYR